jgi:two-component system, chemotaxis family, protein-glutamate methylesterase/glutaminase
MAYEIVVIGASVGGLEAIGLLLRQLPADFPLPIAIAQHRAPAPPEGDLAAIWQRSSALPIGDADDKSLIEPGHAYIAPADYHLLVETRGLFALSTDAPVLYARPSIDVLFESAAEAYGAGVIGVILSGASADGSHGLKTIRDRGGCALVQEPATAESDVLPRSALGATPVNHVMAVADLVRIVAALAGGPRR